jgi:hypothetical protein
VIAREILSPREDRPAPPERERKSAEVKAEEEVAAKEKEAAPA